MKKLVIVLVLMLAGSAFAAQNKNASSSKKPKAPAVDCSKTDDATITKNVQDKLPATPSLKDEKITVETTGGVVKLTGTLTSGRKKGFASITAKRVPCVKSVDNQLTYTKAAPKTATKNKNKNT